jgi:2-polyprenyl-3-methyl-5-hydroxy-6-metoxy-1,4-benzoquinol methylase
MNVVLERRQLVWEQTACPLCAGRQVQPLIESGDPLPGADPKLQFQVVRCSCCGLSYTNPRPAPESIGRFYPEDYSPYQYRDRGTGAGQLLGRRRPRRDSFAAVLPTVPGGRLLDFGCGSGELLTEMDARGWRVTGLDFSPAMVRHVQEQLGLTAIEGTLPHPELAAGSFEAVVMSQSLEHVHDPLRVLRAAHRLLTPGGKVVVAVPNIDSLPFRWFGADWWGLDVPRHLTHFSPDTLGLMLKRAGFRIETIRSVRHNSWLRRSAARAARNPDRYSFWQRLLRYRLPASLAGWYSVARNRANCILATGVRAAA